MFKTIPGFSSYKVNEYGDIVSYATGEPRMLRGTPDPTRNTSKCRLYTLDKKRNVSNYALVAKAFVPNPKNYNFVHFIDNDPSNIHVSNLYWANSGNHSKPVCLFEADSLLPIKVFESVTEAADEYGVKPFQITALLKRKSFRGDKTMMIRPFDDYLDILKRREEQLNA